MNIIELFAKIGLKADTAPANDFLKSIGGIKGQLVGAIAGTLSLAAAVRTVNEQFSASLDIKRFADDTGESVEEMQKWKAVAQQVSGAGDSVASSIRAITSNQEKIRLGQGSISGYQLLGIDPRSDPFKVLEAIRQKTQGLSQGMRRNIAAQFGISNDLVATLELTNKQFDEMAANAFVIPQGNIDSMNKARASLETVKNAANWFKAELVTQLAPAIENISKKIAEWVRQNKEGLIKGIATVFEWLGRIVTMVARVAGVINQVIQATVGWKNALIGIAAAFVLLNASVALPVAGLLIFMAILEDLAVYSRGGKSAFGHLVEAFPVLGAVFDSAFGGLKDVAGAIKAIFSQDWGKLDEITAKWGAMGAVISGIVDSVRLWIDEMKIFYTTLGYVLSGDVAVDLGNMAKRVAAGEGGAMVGNAVDSAIGSTRNLINNIQTTVSPVINVIGATNPQEAAQAVKTALVGEVNKAFTQGQSGKRER